MDLKINGSIVASDMKDIDFAQLSLGQQIILLDAKEKENISLLYNDVNILVLNELTFGNIYHFETLNIEQRIYEKKKENEKDVEEDDNDDENYEEEEYEFDCSEFNEKSFSQSYFVFNDGSNYKIDSINQLWDGDKSFDEIAKKCKSKYSTYNFFSYIGDTSKKNETLFNNILNIRIQNGMLTILLKDFFDIDKYKWIKYCEIIISDHLYEENYKINCNKYEFIDSLLMSIPKNNIGNYYSNDITNFSKMYNAFKYTITEYVNDDKDFISVLQQYNYYKTNISRFFKPIYFDKENNIEVYQRISNSHFDYNYKCEIELKFKSDDYKYRSFDIRSKNARKGESILLSLRGNLPIDPYTGDVITQYIDDENSKFNCSEIYKDAGGVIISLKKDEYIKPMRYYTKLEDVFVLATQKEQDDILSRKKIVDTLVE